MAEIVEGEKTFVEYKSFSPSTLCDLKKKKNLTEKISLKFFRILAQAIALNSFALRYLFICIYNPWKTLDGIKYQNKEKCLGNNGKLNQDKYQEQNQNKTWER